MHGHMIILFIRMYIYIYKYNFALTGNKKAKDTQMTKVKQLTQTEQDERERY